MCLKDPNSFYGQPGATLWFCFYNNTLDSALDTAYGTFQKMLQSSSWFMERGIVTGTKNLIYKPKKDIEFMVGSELQHTLGRNIIWAMADEVSFKKGKNAEVEKSKMWEMYTSILARIMGSYMINGRSAGQIFLVSSKQSEFDFLERYIEKKTAENNRKPVSERTFYRFDYPQWEIHPASEYPSGKKFKIACGNALLANKIIEPEEDTEENIIALQQKGYRIVEPPIELYDMAKMDLERFLTDQAGIASTINSKFLHYSLYEQCVQDEIPDPFEKEILVIGLKDKLRIRDYFHPEVLGYDLVHKKVYVHIDTSLSGDRTGISAVALLGYKDQSRLNESGLTETMNELIYRQLFTVGIQAPKGDQISFRKTREFIFYLVRELNWNIQIVTCDGFQSAQLRQDLYTAGINKDVKNSYISLDKSPEGYDTFKLALQEKRVHLMRRPSNSVFVTEFINLEKDNMTGKVDHPIDGCFTGDTKIRLVDGRSLSINELLLEQQYKDNYVYTFNEEKKRIEPKRIKKVFQTKLTKNLLEVTLDNGQKVLCTPEHRFMLRDGTYKEIKDIEPGTSLMPLYTKYPSEDKRLHKYRLYYEPVEEKWHFEHRSFCKNIIHKKGYVVHHKNYNKNDNTPKNLDCMTTSKHIRLHNNKTKNYKVVSEKVKEWHKRIEGTPEGIAMHKKHGKTWSEKRKDGSHSKKKQAREQRIREIKEIFNVDYLKLTPSERGIYSNKLASLKDPELNKRKASYKEETHKNLHLIHHTKCWITNGVENRYINKTDKIPEGFYKGRVTEWVKDRVITEETRLKMSKKAKKSNIGKVWITNGEIDKFVPKDTILSDSFYYGRSCFKKEYKNHKVISIKQITKPCRVYDLEIEDNHNFALDVGIFVHNSKDLCDSLAGAVFSASKFLKTEDISQLDNYSVLLEANKEEVVVNSNTTLANSLFNGFKKEQKSEADIQNEKIDKELQVIKQLRKNLDPEDKNVTDQQLLDLYNNSFDGDDMLLF